MSPRKLSDGDRQEILSLYRNNSNETTSTLAMRFGVSSSTISRLLKKSLTETEYEDLIQEKRQARITKNEEDDKNSIPKKIATKKESAAIQENPQEQWNLDFEDKKGILGENKSEMETDNFMGEEEQEIINLDSQTRHSGLEVEITEANSEIEEEDVLESVQILAAMYGEDMEDEEEREYEEDMEDEEEEIEDDEIEQKLIVSAPSPESKLQVLPFESANFPRVCYLVVDRYAELVSKPLKDFGHLGNIPDSEYLQLTLPVFDNHKVAKRYCDTKGTFRNRKGKVIKVPDGKLLQKTSTYLKAKGISRIFMDGKIYSLS